jgi:flagellar biosynthesis activator protein FlaF
MSIQAYQRVATRAESPRDLEYRAFGVVTAALLRVHEGGRRDVVELNRAAQENRRLWVELATDCALPSNGLPEATRAQIISLAMFVDKYTSQVLREKADISPLIDINRAIMEGLSGR